MDSAFQYRFPADQQSPPSAAAQGASAKAPSQMKGMSDMYCGSQHAAAFRPCTPVDSRKDYPDGMSDDGSDMTMVYGLSPPNGQLPAMDQPHFAETFRSHGMQQTYPKAGAMNGVAPAEFAPGSGQQINAVGSYCSFPFQAQDEVRL